MGTRIQVRQLGLAAFLKMKGIPLLEVADRAFIFDSDATLEEWNSLYDESCCKTHDTLVCELRRFLKA